MKKTYNNSTKPGEGAMDQVHDVETVGNPDAWVLICKASSNGEEWMKSTKAMEIEKLGCLVQVSTQQGDFAVGHNAVAEAITFVPGATIVKDKNHGHKLVRPADLRK